MATVPLTRNVVRYWCGPAARADGRSIAFMRRGLARREVQASVNRPPDGGKLRRRRHCFTAPSAAKTARRLDTFGITGHTPAADRGPVIMRTLVQILLV